MLEFLYNTVPNVWFEDLLQKRTTSLSDANKASQLLQILCAFNHLGMLCTKNVPFGTGQRGVLLS